MSLQAHAETFRAQNPPSRTISRAAERYLEQYGDPLVMNTYLKVTILVLALVCLMLGLLVFPNQSAAPERRIRASRSTAACITEVHARFLSTGFANRSLQPPA